MAQPSANSLVDLRRKLVGLEPDEPRTLMLRAVLDHRIEQAFLGMREELRSLGWKSFSIEYHGSRIHFSPYVPAQPLMDLMQRHWGVTTNKLPFPLPPKYWGEHRLNP